MKGRSASRVILLAFSAVMGHVMWWTFGPIPIRDHFSGGQMTTLAHPQPTGQRLYLRKTFFVSQRPRHAWLKLLVRDRFELYVNGTWVDDGSQSGVTMATVVDLAPYLADGMNAIAIRAESTTRNDLPTVGVDGLYTLDDGNHRLAEGEWRVAELVERDARYWFARDFDDHHWRLGKKGEGELRAPINFPEEAVTTPRRGDWFLPEGGAREMSFRRVFHLSGRPRTAWLRLTSAASCRLAINGDVLDHVEASDNPTAPPEFKQRTYDLTSFLRNGDNVVALAVESAAGSLQTLADLQITQCDGSTLNASGKASWQSANGQPNDWYKLTTTTQWQAATTAPGDMGVAPWEPVREQVEVKPPLLKAIRNAVFQLLVAIALLAGLLLAGRVLRSRLAPLSAAKTSSGLESVIALAVLPTTIGLVGGLIATFDPRIDPHVIYSGWVVLLGWAMVPAQWFIAKWLERADRHPVPRLGGRRINALPSTGLLLLVVIVGFALRCRGIPDPMSADEMSVYRTTRGFLERGFPSIQVHPDSPIAYVATSELVYVPTAVAGLIFNDPNYVVRAPSVVFGTLTILLIAFVGSRMFCSSAGLMAAAIYAFSTTCIQMSNFGRYFSQLQFFSLLTTYLFFKLVVGRGPIDKKRLWLTTLSFIGMFLSWEASALLAPGMTLAVLWTRRKCLATILADRSIWMAIAVVGAVAILQDSHRTLQQAQRLVYGTGASEVAITLMSRYASFDPLYYLWEASWTRDALIPIVGVLGSMLLAIRHPFRRPASVVLCILLCSCFLQSLLLPVRAWRYSYHLTPLVILLTSATLFATIRALQKLTSVGVSVYRVGMAQHGRLVSSLFGVAVLVFGVGLTFNLEELTSFRVSGGGFNDLKFPDMRTPSEYLRDHIREGDIVLATGPHVANEFLREPTDYWPQSRLHLQAVLDDKRPLPLHRLAGTVMVPSLHELDDIFAKHERIWFLSVPSFDAKLNHDAVLSYIRDQMSVVMEDYSTQLYFRGGNHRPATLIAKDRADLAKAKVRTPPAEWW